MTKTKILDEWLSLRDRKLHGKAPNHQKHTMNNSPQRFHSSHARFFFIMCKAVSLEELNTFIKELNSKTM